MPRRSASDAASGILPGVPCQHSEEDLWSARNPPEGGALVSWFLVETRKDEMPRWCQIGPGGDWIDGRGIVHPYGDRRVFLHVEAERDRDLIPDPVAAAVEMPLAARLLLRPDSDSGWVSPDGRFWGCASVAHEWLLHSLVRKSVHEASREGWVRMAGDVLFHGDATGPSGEIYGGRELTQRQRDTLFDLGFSELEPRRTRLPAHLRGPADAKRPFAVRTEDADRMALRYAAGQRAREEAAARRAP